MNYEIELRGILDKDGKLRVWPAKPEKKQLAVKFVSEKFEFDRDYTEREVNEILKSWNTFGDHQLLRRELCDRKFLARTPNGNRYWRVRPAEEN